MPSRPNLARIGYMTQSDGIYPELTAAENARSSPRCTAFGIPARPDAALEVVELADRAGTLAGSSREACAGGCRWPARSSIGRRPVP